MVDCNIKYYSDCGDEIELPFIEEFKGFSFIEETASSTVELSSSAGEVSFNMEDFNTNARALNELSESLGKV